MSTSRQYDRVLRDLMERQAEFPNAKTAEIFAALCGKPDPTEQEMDQAYELVKSAAQTGDAEASFLFGSLLLNGYHVTQDKGEGHSGLEKRPAVTTLAPSLPWASCIIWARACPKTTRERVTALNALQRLASQTDSTH